MKNILKIKILIILNLLIYNSVVLAGKVTVSVDPGTCARLTSYDKDGDLLETQEKCDMNNDGTIEFGSTQQEKIKKSIMTKFSDGQLLTYEIRLTVSDSTIVSIEPFNVPSFISQFVFPERKILAIVYIVGFIQNGNPFTTNQIINVVNGNAAETNNIKFKDYTSIPDSLTFMFGDTNFVNSLPDYNGFAKVRPLDSYINSTDSIWYEIVNIKCYKCADCGKIVYDFDLICHNKKPTPTPPNKRRSFQYGTLVPDNYPNPVVIATDQIGLPLMIDGRRIIFVTDDSTTNEVTARFPPGPGKKWIGFKSNDFPPPAPLSSASFSLETMWTGLPPGFQNDSGAVWFSDDADNLYEETVFDAFQTTSPASPAIFSDITMIQEGFYNSALNILNMKDVVTAYLANTTPPYAIVDVSRTLIDSVNFTGTFIFGNAPDNSYYLVMKHRNTIETWSKIGGELFARDFLTPFNFTTSISQAFGNNMIQVDNSPIKFGNYSGDIDQNGLVDGNDAALVKTDAFNQVTGYVDTDVTGDGLVDGADAGYTKTNSFNQISVISP